MSDPACGECWELFGPDGNPGCIIAGKSTKPDDPACPPVAALLECMRERDEVQARHTMYLDQIEPILDDIREKRHTGEPAKPDWFEIRKLKSRANAAERELDDTKARIAEFERELKAATALVGAEINKRRRADECAEQAESERDRLLESNPDDMRAAGWAVAVHNDYRQDGLQHTFWLLTKGGRAINGEGLTDADALNSIRTALKGGE